MKRSAGDNMSESYGGQSLQKSIVSRTDIFAQLERILTHSLFQRSQRLSAFVRYAVEKTVAGESDQLKEFTIGVEVFGRGESFDLKPTTWFASMPTGYAANWPSTTRAGEAPIQS